MSRVLGTYHCDRKPEYCHLTDGITVAFANVLMLGDHNAHRKDIAGKPTTFSGVYEWSLIILEDYQQFEGLLEEIRTFWSAKISYNTATLEINLRCGEELHDAHPWVVKVGEIVVKYRESRVH